MAENDEDREAFMAIAWRDFITFAYGADFLRTQFEADTGLRLPSVATSPLDRMIDKATGYGDEVLFRFVLWATETQWGMDEAPKAFREEVERRRLSA